jgi:hypothetical protein
MHNTGIISPQIRHKEKTGDLITFQITYFMFP